MAKQPIPCCQFPTTVLLVDDNKEFLKSASLGLSEESVSYRFFSQPAKALNFLTQEYKPDPFTNRSFSPLLPTQYGQQALDINVRDLYKEVYNSTRFHQVAVMVVDYDMPGMDGIQLCKNVNNPNITKVLLTGAADEHLAVKAFNEGSINHFLRKQEKDIFPKLDQLVKDAQRLYFNRLSFILQSTLQSNPGISTAVTDPGFIRLFGFILEKYNIVEFYQLETIGSYLLLDEDGQHLTLFIQDEDMVKANYLEIQEEAESDFPTEFKEAIQTGKQIVCFHNKDANMYPQPQSWSRYLQPASILNGDKKYFYTLVPSNAVLDNDRILTFKDFKLKALMESEVEEPCFV